MNFNDERPIGQRAQRIVSVRKWKGSQLEQVVEYHDSIVDAIAFIQTQPAPVGDEFEWMVGEYS